MKKLLINKKYIINLGRKFHNTRVIGEFIEKSEEDKNACIIKPINIIKNNYILKNKYLIHGILNTRMIVNYSQVLGTWEG